MPCQVSEDHLPLRPGAAAGLLSLASGRQHELEEFKGVLFRRYVVEDVCVKEKLKYLVFLCHNYPAALFWRAIYFFFM